MSNHSRLSISLSIASVNISPNAQMPCSPWYEQAKACEEGDPKQAAPLPELPPAVAQCPPSYAKVHDVGDKKGGKERSDDLLLEDGLCEEIFARRSEHEEVDETEKPDDVCELEHSDLCCPRERVWRCAARGPWSLGIVGLDRDSVGHGPIEACSGAYLLGVCQCSNKA